MSARVIKKKIKEHRRGPGSDRKVEARAGREGAPAQARQKITVRSASPARRAAFEVLRRVEDEGAFATPLLASVAEELRADDRALSHELVLGCLRRQLWLDRLLEHFAGRAAESLDAPVRRALRLGLYQLRFLSRIPASAAVNESVNLVREARLHSAAGFVNAVLRRATREPERDPVAGIEDDMERLAVETSHPAWLIARWVEAFGLDEAKAFAQANNETPPVALRVNSRRVENEVMIGRLMEAGLSLVPSRVAPGGWRVKGSSHRKENKERQISRDHIGHKNEPGTETVQAVEGHKFLRQAVSEGFIYMQDEASQLVAQVFDVKRGERVLDACAAPGSKTTHMAVWSDEAALIVAGDKHAHRLRVLREAMARQNLQSIRTITFDAEEALPFADHSFDGVLVDAPCTGTGTLRHNPEIRWRITPADILESAARQQRILTNTARVVRQNGGRLVYSTCSVEREENEAVVAEFLAGHADFKQVPLTLRAHDFLTPTGAARTFPHRDDTDGFFISLLERQN